MCDKQCCELESINIGENTYFIESLLHKSNVSKVYIAHKNCKLKIVQKYAIKIYLSDYSTQAENEYYALKKLQLDGIVKMESFDLKKGIIVMPKYSHDLFDLLSVCQEKQKQLSNSSIRKYFTELIDTLNYMHSKHIVHLDVKPENILLTKSHHPVYIDFGFAMCLESNNENIFISKGTPFYAAPEIEFHERGYDPFKCDVWALGMTLYLLLERRRPFKLDLENDTTQIWNRLKEKKLKFYTKNSYYKEYHRMISKMLEKNPKQRWNIQNVKEENDRINKKYLHVRISSNK